MLSTLGEACEDAQNGVTTGIPVDDQQVKL